jgi:chemotaxis protein MotB
MAVVLSGCVTQGTYDAMLADRNQVISDRDKRVQDLEAALRAEEATSKMLSEQVHQLTAKQAELEAAYGKTQSDKNALEGMLEELKRRKAESEARVAEFKALLDKFKTLIDAGKLKVTMREGRMVVELATDILFASGSASLSRDGKAAIAEVTGLLTSIEGRKFQVEGHTDNIPMKGAYKSNWELASARALTVLHAMVDAGMPPDRISAASFGDSRPTKPNDTPENRAANRRIEIVVVPDLSSLPGFDELQRVGQ